MIEIKYNTRVFIDPKTNHIKIRVRWNKTEETTFSLEYRADREKWDGRTQRPISGTMHKFADQNCSARIITTAIEESLDQIKIAFRKCEIDSVMPTKEILKAMVRSEQPKEEVKVKKTLAELYEDFLQTVSDDNNWTEKVHYKYQQTWNHLNACFPGITLEQLTKAKMRELKNWYIKEGYRNVTINKMFVFLKTFIKWLKAEGYEIQPGVLEYKTNLIIVPKTITFLTHKELMHFYGFKFAENEKNLELIRDLFCFMAFTF